MFMKQLLEEPRFPLYKKKNDTYLVDCYSQFIVDLIEDLRSYSLV